MRSTKTAHVLGTALILTALLSGRAPAQSPETIVVTNALDRPVLGYTNHPADYASRVREGAQHQHAPWDAESFAADIEDFGLAENLMIAVAIEDAGGAFVAHPASSDCMLSDLTGFIGCLSIAADLMRVTAGEQGGARRTATRLVVKLDQAHAALGKAIQVRRGDFRTKTTNVRIPEIIGQDQNDVGSGRCILRRPRVNDRRDETDDQTADNHFLNPCHRVSVHAFPLKSVSRDSTR